MKVKVFKIGKIQEKPIRINKNGGKTDELEKTMAKIIGFKKIGKFTKREKKVIKLKNSSRKARYN